MAVEDSPRPTFRRRLFSRTQRRHAAEASASTNATLTPGPSTADDGHGHKRTSSEDGESSQVEEIKTTASSPRPRRKSTMSKRRKPFFLSRVVAKVVPCVGPSATQRSSLESLREKRRPEVPPIVVLDVAPQPSTSSNGAADVPASPANLDTSQQPSPTDTEVIVPPPPSARLLSDEETDGLTSGAVQPPGSTGDSPIVRTHTRDSGDTSSEGSSIIEERAQLDEQEEEERLIRNGGTGVPMGPDGLPRPLLPPIAPEHVGRKCLVLDLDETLVHSSFRAIPQPDFIVPVEIEYHWHHFHVLKRPGVDAFLEEMGKIYEVVVFTASLAKYADPVLDKLDIHKVVAHRLFRESCYSHKGNYVKDLSQLGRPIGDTIILDNSPASYIFHPHNAVPVSSWFNDPHDAELTDLVPFLADLTDVEDVTKILDGSM